jgi:hypothetical protein
MLREQIGRFQGPDGRNVYLIGANPSFDDRMLRKMYRGITPGYHHRMIDVEAYDMGSRRAATPRGLADIARELVPDFCEQDHEARSDVRVLVAAFHALRGSDPMERAILLNKKEIKQSDHAFRAAETRADHPRAIAFSDLKPL